MKAIQTSFPVLLGMECGGTHSVAAVTLPSTQEPQLFRFGPANLRLVSDPDLVRHFQRAKVALAASARLPDAMAIGMAGVRTEADCRRIRSAAARVWPGVPCRATHDLETAWRAGEEEGKIRPAAARVLVLSGTGSCCFARTDSGQTAKIGGWGHILGDKGSGYDIGLRTLKAVVYYYDRDGEWSRLGSDLLRALQLNEPNDLIAWVQQATKTDIAALAVHVFAAAWRREKIARDILEGAAHSLAKDAAACARRLARPGAPVRFVLAGSILLKQPRFARHVARVIQDLWPRANVVPLPREGVWGALALAREEFERQSNPAAGLRRGAASLRPRRRTAKTEPAGEDLSALALSPTEQRNPRSLHLDTLPLDQAIELMLREESRVPAALLRERQKIARAITWIARALRRGGRLFYVGAGTSGRLGVLDASECPPTFRSSPEQVQGIVAGGQRALWESVEGAEDDLEAGGRAVRFRKVGRRDVVVGIAASGRTPFVWGGLIEARRRGARTVLVCFHPRLVFPPRRPRPDLVIAPKVGPEVLTGSTRLKSGTATKLILNLFTTLAMVRLGKVRSNLMIDVSASNTKLRDRATRIVRDLTGADYAASRAALERTGWNILAACRRLGGGRGAPQRTSRVR